jgi:hypothetical protein
MKENIQNSNNRDLIEYAYYQSYLTLEQSAHICEIFSFDKEKVEKFLKIINKPLAPKYKPNNKTFKEIKADIEESINQTKIVKEFLDKGGDIKLLI